MVVIINPDDEHDVPVLAPVSNYIMAVGPAYQIRGLMMSTMCGHQCQSFSDDVMAVGPVYQLNPYGSLDPHQPSKLIP